MPDHPQHRKINPLAIIAIILILLALGMLFLIFAPGPRMKWALSMGEKYLTDCEYTQAVTMFSRAIRVDDRIETAYVGRAEAYIQLNQPAAAVDDLTFVIDELTTDDADVYIQRAEAYTMLGDYDAAQADLTTAASLGADTTEAEETLAAFAPEQTTEPEKAMITVSLPTQIRDTLNHTEAVLQHNADGQLIDYTYTSDGSSQHYTYDEHGNEASVTNSSDDQQTTYANTYDEDGNLLTSLTYYGSILEYTEIYTYDEHGNMTHYESDVPRDNSYDDWTYTYDEQGRVTSATGYSMGTAGCKRTYTYTDVGYTEASDYNTYGEHDYTVTTYAADGTVQKYEYHYGYGSNETIYFKGKPFLYNDYDADGNITVQQVWKYDTSTFANGLLTQYRYVRSVDKDAFSYVMDADGTPHLVEPSSAPTDEFVTEYVYTYDADGNVISRTAYTDTVLSEEVTYTVMTVPGDYSFGRKTPADRASVTRGKPYKEYVIDDSRTA